MARKEKKGRGLVALLVVVAILLGVGGGVFATLWLSGSFEGDKSKVASVSSMPVAASGSVPVASSLPAAGGTQPPAQPLPEEMRAMWISFLELKKVDFSSAENARAAFATMFDNCAAMGLNTVIVAVRPFGDALYKSSLYPWSHLLTGAQGQDPGYDPLQIMVEEAHSRNLRFEAWLNPYRVKNPSSGLTTLSADNPAQQNPGWVRTVGNEMWYNPGIQQVEDLVAAGIKEIVDGYGVDGIHLDDYFYPTGIDESFDAEEYAASGGAMALADWRRDNINRMVQAAYGATKSAGTGASFGISMQGNNENNYTQMYADARQWMGHENYVDYVMPQLYWGFNYRTASGRDSYAFDKICDEWAFYPRLPSVKLYAGLAAYRIGMLQPDGTRAEFGDGGSNDQSEWESGHNLADQVLHLRTVTGFSGFALFRYDYLYQEGDALGGSERQALQQTMA